MSEDVDNYQEQERGCALNRGSVERIHKKSNTESYQEEKKPVTKGINRTKLMETNEVVRQGKRDFVNYTKTNNADNRRK